jgi:3-(methylthio)propionyl---CoA ligase
VPPPAIRITQQGDPATMSSPFERDLDKNPGNYVALSPLSFLRKSACVYPDHIATIHGERRLSWSEVYTRCRLLASALERRGIRRGDTVAAMLPNVPAMVEMHFGPAMLGAVVNTLNTRLDAETIAFMLDHAEREFCSSTANSPLSWRKRWRWSRPGPS